MRGQEESLLSQFIRNVDHVQAFFGDDVKVPDEQPILEVEGLPEDAHILPLLERNQRELNPPIPPLADFSAPIRPVPSTVCRSFYTIVLQEGGRSRELPRVTGTS